MSVWFFGDPHFDHENILWYCNRPFPNVVSMNETIIERYFQRVRKGDTVYFLGDMSFGRGSHPARYWLSELQRNESWARFYYIKGSHDNKIRETSIGLDCVDVSQSKVISVEGKKIGTHQVLLIHDPNQAPSNWDGWVIHGHNHNYAPRIDLERKRINVSLDVTNFQPIHISYIQGILFEFGGCNESK